MVIRSSSSAKLLVDCKFVVRSFTLLYLVILVVAAALLIGWLAFAIARLTSSEVRLSRFHAGSLQGASGGAPSISTGNGSSGEPVAAEREELGVTEDVEGREDLAAPEDFTATKPQDSQKRRRRSKGEQQLYDEADAEQAVYARLYGDRGRRD